MKQKANHKDHHDSEQRKNQRIWKPPFTPVSEAKAKADKMLLLSFLLLFSRRVHVRSSRSGSDTWQSESFPVSRKPA